MVQGNGSEPKERDQIGPLDGGHSLGVRVVVDAEPIDAAARLADQVGGDVITDADAARAAFATRADAARTMPVVLQDDEFDTLIAQAEELSSLAEQTPIDDAAVEELRELAAAIGRTDRIRVRTEVEFSEALHRRLSVSSGVAVHPETIRQAAGAVTDAERDMADIDRAITELGDRPRPEQVKLHTPEPVADLFDDHRLERQRRRRVFALCSLPIVAGLGFALFGAGVAAPISVAVLAAGLAVSITLVFRAFRSGHVDDRDEREASALLAAATSNAERMSQASVQGRLAEEEWLSRRSQLETARERAEEKARSARRHWETLAGIDADPYDLDSVLQLHDPQFVISGAATQTSPTVRTVNAVHRKAMARWKVAWAALGYDDPPAPEEVDEHIARLTDREARADAQRAAERLRAAEAWASAGETIDRPMILVEPYTWVEEEELSAMLKTLPVGAEVILVTR